MGPGCWAMPPRSSWTAPSTPGLPCSANSTSFEPRWRTSGACLWPLLSYPTRRLQPTGMIYIILYYLYICIPYLTILLLCTYTIYIKHIQLYRKMWDIIQGLVVYQPGCPQRVTSDFEKAAITVIKETFPTAAFSGCFFHYKQAIFRHGVMHHPHSVI